MSKQEEVAYLADLIRRYSHIYQIDIENAIHDKDMSTVYETEGKIARLKGQLAVAKERDD